MLDRARAACCTEQQEREETVPMGMFDTVRCAFPLPSHQDEELQA